ncbi:MAG: uridine kinase [Saprospiraceae bacterium]|nr:uridine kinase [Saprospiraceae bacterium]
MIIGIAGGTGSGKTTVVEKIIDLFNEDQVALLSQDSYYKDNSHLTMEQRNAINYDHPDSIDFSLLCQHLLELKEGRNIAQPTYSYQEHNRLPETRFTEAKKVTIVEGILIFTLKELRDLCDVKVFVDTPDDERLIRRIRRDLKERGRDIEEILCRYEDTLRPMHLQFIEPTKRYADIIVPEGGNNSVAIRIIANTIKDKLRTQV